MLRTFIFIIIGDLLLQFPFLATEFARTHLVIKGARKNNLNFL